MAYLFAHHSGTSYRPDHPSIHIRTRVNTHSTNDHCTDCDARLVTCEQYEQLGRTERTRLARAALPLVGSCGRIATPGPQRPPRPFTATTTHVAVEKSRIQKQHRLSLSLARTHCDHSSAHFTVASSSRTLSPSADQVVPEAST